jgi:hypothetical protein
VHKFKDYQNKVEVELKLNNSLNYNKVIQDYNRKYNQKITKLICYIPK